MNFDIVRILEAFKLNDQNARYIAVCALVTLAHMMETDCARLERAFGTNLRECLKKFQ